MIAHVTGNLLEADVEALVNTVNCVGAMGKGLALQFKQTFPDNFKAYKLACDHMQVRPGRMFVYETGDYCNPKYIINFPTKGHWRDGSRMEDIESGLDALVVEIKARHIHSIAIPQLGCGLGCLDWREVQPLIKESLADIRGLCVLLYGPLEDEK